MLSCLCRGVLVDARAPCVCIARMLRAQLVERVKSPCAAPISAASSSYSFRADCELASTKAAGALLPLDSSHRVAGGEALDFRFRSGQLRMTESEAATLSVDCEMAFALDSSNWLGATAKPRCALERLARAIFQQHTAGVSFDPATSGAEWWTQVRDGGRRHEGIPFHWDVDEHRCALPGGVHVHPHLSTVTYLTNVGAPTLVLDAGSPKAATKSAIATMYGPVRSGYLSYPKVGRTIVFDGAKLHGAVPCTGDHGAPAGMQRVTFLLNVWLGHRPQAVQPMFSSLAASMSQLWQPHPAEGALNMQPPSILNVHMPAWKMLHTQPQVDGAEAPGYSSTSEIGGSVSAVEGDHGSGPAHEVLEVSFGGANDDDEAHALRVCLPSRMSSPSELSDACDSGCGSYQLIFSDGAATLGPNTSGLESYRSREAGTEKPDMKRRRRKKKVRG